MTAVAEPFNRGNTESVTSRREERLLRLLERASASSRFNLGERWLFVLGGALVVAGFVVVVIGWAGASRTVLVAGQIPYVISGGLIGLGLVFLGGFLYFGHWVAVLVRESRERGAEDRDDLAMVQSSLYEINRSLAALATALEGGQRWYRPEVSPETGSETSPAAGRDGLFRPEPGGPGGAPFVPGGGLAGDVTAPVLLATSAGTMAHRPGCRALAGKPNLRPVSVAEGLKPCGMCRPLDRTGLV